MNNSQIPNLNLNNSENKILKQLWPIANKHLIAIDESIIQKLGIDDKEATFLEQELRKEDNTILMRVKKK